MAAVTFEIGTADVGNTPNPSGAFTPATDDLLVVFCVGSATVPGVDVLTSSISGNTFTLITSFQYDTSTAVIQAFVANQLITSAEAISQTVTWTPADTATSSEICVFAVAGVTRTGISAIKQSAGQANQAAATTPAPVFAANALTGNPTLGGVGNETNPATMTAPTNWTEPVGGDIGQGTPIGGLEVVFRDSGFTGTTITWGSASDTNFASLILEIDSSAVANKVKDPIGKGVVPWVRV